MRRFSLIAAIIAVFAGALAAQRLPDADIPPMPPSGFSDKDGVLGKDSGARQRITEIIHQLETRHGYRLIVILERVLISTSPNDLAAQLQQEWLPDGGGLVVVFESDTRNLGFGRGLDATEGFVENKAGVPAYELVAIISKALTEAETAESTELYVEKLVVGIGTNLLGYFERKKSPADGSRSLKLALVTIGALSLLALCGMGLGWIMGRSEKKQSQRRVFPSVAVPERLAAPYGGGGGGGYSSFGSGQGR